MATFTGDKVFQMAMEMEQTGEVLYEALAAATSNHAVADLCRRIAEQEREHYTRFEQMRAARLKHSADAPLTCEEMDFVQTLLNERVVPNPTEVRRVVSTGSLTDVLDLAIQMEHDAVSFYCDILRCVEDEDTAAVARIIEEEKRHARDLAIAKRNLN